MDQTSIGELIRKLRTDMGLTQKQLAEQLHVSDKAVSKWECGNGCPDLSLLTALSFFFGTDIQVLLNGRIDKNETEKGDMKKLRFLRMQRLRKYNHIDLRCGYDLLRKQAFSARTESGRGQREAHARGHRRRVVCDLRSRNVKGKLYLLCGLPE